MPEPEPGKTDEAAKQVLYTKAIPRDLGKKIDEQYIIPTATELPQQEGGLSKSSKEIRCPEGRPPVIILISSP